VQAGTSTPADEVRSKLDEAASTIGEQAQRIATTQLGSQKERAAGTLQSIAQTLRDGTSSLEEQQPQVASLGQEAAVRIEQLSDYVEQHDVGAMVGDAERLARQQPAIFLGAAFAVGFVAARFLKASNPAPTGSSYAESAMGDGDASMGDRNSTMGDRNSSMGDRNSTAEWRGTSPYTASNGGVLEP